MSLNLFGRLAAVTVVVGKYQGVHMEVFIFQTHDLRFYIGILDSLGCSLSGLFSFEEMS